MSNANQKQQFHITVRGIVQGVYFRASTQEQAKKLQLTGWVRNTSDGHVELMAQDTTEQLGEFMRWLHKGPPALLRSLESPRRLYCRT